jgi:hypothetical protein
MVASALAVTVFVGIVQSALNWSLIKHGMVDTDDAMRLFMVRDLLGGTGWFNVHVDRVQPPLGLAMHWSRLIDGGLGGLVLAFRAVLSPAAAEVAATSLWPVLWAFPATLAALAAARRLGGAAAVFACLLFLLLYQPAFLQFRPGRIDHDNVQIAFAAIAFAGALAVDRGRWGAIAAGAGTGLLLNIGLEALPFAAILGASIGVRAALTPALASAALRYAAALALATVVPYVGQTAPALLLTPQCDQIGFNLVAGLLVAAGGLAAFGLLLPRLGTAWVRLAALVLVGAAAGAVYLAIHPSCVRGPFGDIDPRLFPIWLDHVNEMRSLPQVVHEDPRAAVGLAAGPLAALVALVMALLRPGPRRDPAWLLAAVTLVAACAAEIFAVRSSTYAMWFGVPIMAAALVRIGMFGNPPVLVRTTAAACLASPLVITALAVRLAAGVVAPPPKEPTGMGGASSCTAAHSFATLAAEPRGLVGGDVDLGPFILLYTGDSVLAAPYHRAGPGILDAEALMTAAPDKARDLAVQWGLDYVAHCAAGESAAAATKPPKTLVATLVAGDIPGWLQPLSDDGRLMVYRVAPLGLRGPEP